MHFSNNSIKNTDKCKAKLIWVGYAVKILHIFILMFVEQIQILEDFFFLIAVRYSEKCAYQLFLGPRDSQESFLEEEFLLHLRCYDGRGGGNMYDSLVH